MMTPFTDPYTAMMACGIPVLAALLGTLLLGGVIGWLYSPGPGSGTPEQRARLEGLRALLADSQDRLAATSTLLQQRMDRQEQERADERQAAEQRITALNRQMSALREVLAQAQSQVRAAEKNRPDLELAAKIARLERANTRIPGLLKELDDLREALRLEGGPRPPEKSSTALPSQVYRVMSEGFGRRIAQDDLQLVEGIGPKIQQQLKKHGLKTWNDIAAAKPEELKKVLAEGGERFQMHDPSSWPEQCRLMAEHRWEELRKYQRKLSHTR